MWELEVRYYLNLFAECLYVGKKGNQLLFVLELHQQREVSNHKDNISS